MFQLIVTLLAIAIGAAAALAAVYYGGHIFQDAGASAEALKLVNVSQQLAGWIAVQPDRARSEFGLWPNAWLDPRHRTLPRRLGWRATWRDGSYPPPAASPAVAALLTSSFWRDPIEMLPLVPWCAVTLAKTASHGGGLVVTSTMQSGSPGCATLHPAQYSPAWHVPAGSFRVMVGGKLSTGVCAAVNRLAIGQAKGSATSGGNHVYGCDANQIFYRAIGV